MVDLTYSRYQAPGKKAAYVLIFSYNSLFNFGAWVKDIGTRNSISLPGVETKLIRKKKMYIREVSGQDSTSQ